MRNYISKDRDKVINRLIVRENNHFTIDFTKMKEKTAFCGLGQEGQKKNKEGKHKNSHIYGGKKDKPSKVKL